MRVLLLIPTLGIGGAERAFTRYMAALLSAGYDVRLLTLSPKIELPIPPGGSVESLSARPIRGSWLDKLRYAFLLRRWIGRHEREFDLMISTLPLMDEIVRKAGLRNVWHRIANTLGEEVSRIGSGIKAKRRRRRYRAMYAASNIIAVSNGVRDDLHQNFGVPLNRIQTIYNPFPVAEIEALSRANDPEIPADLFILHAARFMPQKRFDVLLDAFRMARVPHRLVLLTNPHPDLEAMIAERGLSERVVVAGARQNPYNWMRKAAAVVLSSDREGFPNVIPEALICGTPVVSTDCPSGPREILRGELASWLSPRGDPAALARNIERVLSSPPAISDGLRQQFSEVHFAAQIAQLGRQTGSSRMPANLL
jgi:glycosyltransferase involved in cell wall biosynthesis